MIPAAGNDLQHWETCGDAWIALLRHVWSAGEAGMEDLGPIIEGPPVLFEIASLSWQDPVLSRYGDRNRLARWASAPRGRDDLAGGLGARLRDLHGVDQLHWAADLLRARPWTTSAWVSLNDPGDPADTVPCLVALAFRLRAYRLVMTAMFRSQNVHRAYLSYIPLREVQLEVADELGLPAGPMRVFVDVPHVAVRDADSVASILAAQPEAA
ncbi:hypothetical protein [Actinomadura rupiterrae]|uniref:hypothetical protein n=1 Tax=Actinomadura rupiterrae TaxID=559627 RepID=UPI0020A4C3AD|nr:hypothetical protein [Actinomadura rupiterrae]MCP2339838.1 thymidylate synthase [Actinomadura rupiterrae]